VFEPALAANLTRIIQGLVVLFVSADILIIYLWQLRRKIRGKRALPEDAPIRVPA
jgi:simple sugar transport system permease protein